MWVTDALRLRPRSQSWVRSFKKKRKEKEGEGGGVERRRRLRRKAGRGRWKGAGARDFSRYIGQLEWEQVPFFDIDKVNHLFNQKNPVKPSKTQ